MITKVKEISVDIEIKLKTWDAIYWADNEIEKIAKKYHGCIGDGMCLCLDNSSIPNDISIYFPNYKHKYLPKQTTKVDAFIRASKFIDHIHKFFIDNRIKINKDVYLNFFDYKDNIILTCKTEV